MNRLKYLLALALALLTLLAGKPRSSSHFLNGVASAHTISSPFQIASTDAALEWLAVENAPVTFDSDTPSYSVNVPHTVDKTIVRAGATDSDASYIVRLGNNVQGVSLLPTATPTDDPPMNFRVSGVDDDSVSLQWARAPRNRGIVSGKIRVYEHMGSAYQYVASYDAGILAGELRASHLKPDTLYKFTLIFSNFADDAVRSQSVTARTQASQTTATPTPTPLATQTTTTPTPTPLGTPATTTPTPTPTDAPANFSVSDVGLDWVSLQWGAAPGNLGITSAEIAIYEHNGSGYHYVDRRSVGISGRSIVLYYLKSDTLYKFSLRFLDVDNDVVRSQTVTARTQATQTTATPTPTPLATQPTATPTDDPPMNFRVSGVGRDSISLQWERAPRNRGIVSGKIEAHEHMGSAYQFVASYDAGLLAGNLRASHLKPDTLYKFILIFSNQAGDVVRRQTVTERTQTTQTTATPTPTPTAASALPVPRLTAQAGADAIDLRWTEVSGAVRYELMVWWDAGTGWQPIGGANLTGTSYTHTGVTAGTTYYYTIRAVNAAGREGNWLQEYASATVSALTLTPTPLSTQTTATPTPTPLAAPTDAPVNFRVSDVGRDWVSLQWEAAPGNLGITSAEIAIYEHNGSGYHYVDRRSVGISGRSIVLYYLKSDTLYKFSLRFLDVDNDVVRSQTVTARTQATQTTATPTPTPLATQPTATPTDDPPMNFRVSGVGRDSISLQWERAPRNRGIVSGKIEAHEHMGSAYQFVVNVSSI
ncbi:MAG: fibronectin type III domain-containing protein [Caldilineaceae bacterium]|nr:fibronectin type III domain-containing protein [Caldilineaceae bacterium]MDE0463225.1 fibronectin type III domain-containing protein [Caldilineaceae bacterium]